MDMKLQQILCADIMQRTIPSLPKLLSKYNTFSEDIKSLFSYYILRKRGKIEIKPVGLGIIPSTACNASCSFCAYKFFKGRREFMSLNIFKKAVDYYIKIGGKSVGLTPTLGEVLVDPGFFDKVKYLKRKGLSCSLFTNAILLKSNDNLNKLLESGIDYLHFDFSDVVPEYSAKVFGISEASAKDQVDGILKFLEELHGRKIKMNVNLDFRPMRPVRKIVKDMKKTPFWKLYEKKVFTMNFLQTYDNWGGQIKKGNLLGIQELKRVPKVKIYPCQGLLMLSVLPDGDVRLCGCRVLETFKDDLVIGNITKDSLGKICKGKRWREIIDDFQNGKRPKVCDNCSFYRPLIS